MLSPGYQNSTVSLNPKHTMKTHAEYVSPGHPDRLADAIAEGIVTEAVKHRPNALVAVEIAVNRDVVFIDGRIAAGIDVIDKHRIVREVYKAAGYSGPWIPDPDKLRIIDDLCEGELDDLEARVRPLSDDQNIIVGYARDSESSNNLPPAHWVAGEIGRRLFQIVRTQTDLSAIFGPDFKVLASLEERRDKVTWNCLVLSIMHAEGLGWEQQYRLLLPHLQNILADLEARGLVGVSSTFDPRRLNLNGAGEFSIGGPHGDNGLSGKKLVVDHYGPSVPIGGGALSGKDPYKIDKCGALRARQLAKRLVREGANEAHVTLAWAPGGDSPFAVQAITTTGGVRIQLPREQLPNDEWFSIKQIVKDLKLTERDWQADLLRGYFANPTHPWESAA
jgi:S-adenosylmethionine synthetase